MTCLPPGLEPEKACLRDFSGNFLKKSQKTWQGMELRVKLIDIDNRYQ
jgi:hypothetical protein